ncbi:MAG: glutamate-5-semialdehyde dehydrogenase [bacterium]|nr:glutamate-5-semialdehyde dehydrogenase [bacterium]
MELKEQIIELARQAKSAARTIATVSSSIKNLVLSEIADAIEIQQEKIITENEKDIATGKTAGVSKSFLDRLTLTPARIKLMADGLREIVKLPDPVGEITRMWRRPNGLLVGKMRVPLGVIGIIYESRPNVTVDAAGLCLKSGNAVILRGGSESIHSNKILVEVMQDVCRKYNVPPAVISFVSTPDRQAINELLKLNQYLDVIIPRGGESLIRTVVEQATMPVIKHYKGVCAVYVDAEADLTIAEEVTFNAKVQRPAVCNAIENLLVHKDIATVFLPRMLDRLSAAGVEIRGCPEVVKLYPKAILATAEDWSTEYNDLILSVKIVDDIDSAIAFITQYGSMHSDAIITQNYRQAWKFIREVDSSAVFVNASTRFNDGYEFGLGAEIGISTDKLHARGPMGLEELTCQKYIVFGEGQIRT